MIYLQLFLSFVQIGLFTIGGGYAAMPIIKSQVVISHSWLTMQEFTDLVTIAEMTPGPIAINSATFVGIRVGGFFGALCATFGFITPSLIIVSLLAYIYQRYKELNVLKSVLGSLRPTVVAMIASAALSILAQVALNSQPLRLANIQWLGVALFCIAIVILRKFKLNPILIMVLCGVANLVIGVVTT